MHCSRLELPASANWRVPPVAAAPRAAASIPALQERQRSQLACFAAPTSVCPVCGVGDELCGPGTSGRTLFPQPAAAPTAHASTLRRSSRRGSRLALDRSSLPSTARPSLAVGTESHVAGSEFPHGSVEPHPGSPKKKSPEPQPNPAAVAAAAAASQPGAAGFDEVSEQPCEAGLLPAETLHNLGMPEPVMPITGSSLKRAGSGSPGPGEAGSKRDTKAKASVAAARFAYRQEERNQIRESWDTLMRWSRVLQTRRSNLNPLEATEKVVVFGGGSFGTAMGAALANQKKDMEVVLLLRDPYLCKDINTHHCNTRYLKEFTLPTNVRATTSAAEAILGAQYAVHAVPVQSSRAFLVGIKDILPSNVPIICVSKGLEVGTGMMMSDLIPSALERKQPAVFLSGPSFAKEVMENRPTGVVAACKDTKLAREIQALFASNTMRVNTTSDVVGVEICGALKNVLAIAAGIVEGLDLGHNALAALIAQGCSEIRWLAEKMGAKPTTMSGLSGLGDIMLTCYGSLSRNRSVGMRLGQGEKLEDILASSPQVAEGVATAGVVVALARKYRVSLPVLTAVAQVLDNALTPSEAVQHIMQLPQIEEH